MKTNLEAQIIEKYLNTLAWGEAKAPFTTLGHPWSKG
jgi:hypothetical protein